MFPKREILGVLLSHRGRGIEIWEKRKKATQKAFGVFELVVVLVLVER